MKLLYISMHRFLRDRDGNLFSTGLMGPNYFEKYLTVFDEVTVLGYEVANDTTIKKAIGNPIHDTDRIRYLLAPCGAGQFSTSFENRAIRAIADEQAKTADAVACKSASGAALAKRYAEKYRKPFLVEVVGCPWDAMWNHSYIGKAIAPFSYLSLRKVVKDAAYVSYVTEKFLQDRYPTKGKSVGVSDVELQPVDESVLDSRIRRIAEANSPLRIGTAGTVEIAYKGQEYVIRALAELKAKGDTGFEYHLAGGGNPQRLKELAETLGVSDQVVFEGSLPHDAMFDWLDSLDLYIQPSLTEGMPRALIEAMSRGLPAIGSRVGGIPELLGEDCVFPRKDTEAITKLLSWMNPEQMTKMAKQNFAHARQFQKELLEEKRIHFYTAFAKAAKEKQK